MTRFAKPSLSVTDQLALLVGRGMTVDDPDAARRALERISYYRLRAYWLPFEIDPTNGSHRLVAGTRFGDVLAIYDFDRRLRLLVIDAVERVEVALRGAWAHRLAMAHGPHGYLDPALYPDRQKLASNLKQLTEEFTRSHDTFVEHYRQNYSSPALPPVWMTAEFISFGLLSKFLSALGPAADRKAIARQFDLSPGELAGLAHHLATVRNICAHHGRLWNRRLVVTAPVPTRPHDLAQTIEPTTRKQVYNSLVLILHVLQQVAPQAAWRADLLGLPGAHPTGDLGAMGFPADWAARPLWT